MRLHWLAAAGTIAVTVAIAPLAAQQKVNVGHLASPTVSVRLFTAAIGSVHVVGWDKDSIELTGVVPNGSRVETSGGAPMEAVKGMKMFVETPTELTGREGQLVLKVPRGARVWVKTGTTDMDVTGVTGGLDLNVVGGLITVHGSSRELRAEIGERPSLRAGLAAASPDFEARPRGPRDADERDSADTPLLGFLEQLALVGDADTEGDGALFWLDQGKGTQV